MRPFSHRRFFFVVAMKVDFDLTLQEMDIPPFNADEVSCFIGTHATPSDIESSCCRNLADQQLKVDTVFGRFGEI